MVNIIYINCISVITLWFINKAMDFTPKKLSDKYGNPFVLNNIAIYFIPLVIMTSNCFPMLKVSSISAKYSFS